MRLGLSPMDAMLRAVLDERAASVAFASLDIDDRLMNADASTVDRATFAMALNVALFDDLLARVPDGAAYVAGIREQGGRVRFDHGALRTIRFATGATGALPAGVDAFDRILTPLGYTIGGRYPLPRLSMSGYAYTHRDLPETIPQFFVSELHVERFDAALEAAARRVFGETQDPLTSATKATLDLFAERGEVPLPAAIAALPNIVAAFGRHHPTCAISDYEALLAQSAEAAWIATEGNAFNHATDRVDDVDALAARLRAEGYPVKPQVEVSGSGRVRQTALSAQLVARTFLDPEGRPVSRMVPGSFYEFISRDQDPATGKLDLAFDSGNATGIFAMTSLAA